MDGIFIMIIIAILALILVFVSKAQTDKQTDEKKVQERKELQRKRMIEKARLIKQENSRRESLYGPLTRELGGFASVETIQIYDKKDILFIGDKEIEYKKTLNFKLNDNASTIIKEGNTQTKTSTGNMIARGVAGGLLFGGLGALAGAATAKKLHKKKKAIPSRIIHLLYISISIAQQIPSLQ